MDLWGRLLAAAIDGKDAGEGVLVPMRGAG